MILQALNDYYHRLAADPDSGVAPPGFSEAKVSFGLKLSLDGRLLDDGVVDLRQEQGRRLVPRLMLVPEVTKRAYGITANFLCDNCTYVLGADDEPNSERSRRCFEAFRTRHQELSGSCEDAGLQAISRFLDAWDPSQAVGLPLWEDIRRGGNIVFLLEERGALGLVHERPAARKAWLNARQAQECAAHGQCLVTGTENAPIARLHAAIKGAGGQSSGTSLVSFNLDAFTSYGKEQNHNAPVSEAAAFSYTTALNRLLLPGSRQKMLISDMALVFWAERRDKAEDLLIGLFAPPAESRDNEDAKGPRLDPSAARSIRHVLEAARDGSLSREIVAELADDPDVSFFLLGLSPNAARLAVRFWEKSSFGRLVERIGRHYRDMALVRQFESDPEFPPVWRILQETAIQRKRENIPPLLGGALMRAVLTGGAYPLTLYSALLGRIRADHEVNHVRAAMLKAVLVRNFSMEVPMSLDTASRDTAYRLGRLFAILESLQYAAVRPQATIKDRYFGSASATPGNVFPALLRNAQHHISKAGWGDQSIQEVLDGVDGFPAHLDMKEQGLFVLGYYHQRKQTFDEIAARKQARTKED